MEDGRLPKDVLYSELECGKRTVGRPFLGVKDTCKRDLSALNLPIEEWEDPKVWQRRVHEGLISWEAQIHDRAVEKCQKGTKMQLTEPSKTLQLLLHQHQSTPVACVGQCTDPALGSTVSSGAAKTDPLCGANPLSHKTDVGLLLRFKMWHLNENEFDGLDVPLLSQFSFL